MEYREAYCGSYNKKQALKNVPPRTESRPASPRENPLNQGPDGKARKDCVPE
jgi:hypothetical protein